MGGATIEAACERALFQIPEATAAAVSYTSAQLTLLADLTMHVWRSNARDEPAALGNLRRAMERDRFGLVANVLAIRDGCTPDICVAFVLLDDTNRIRNNLAERTYDVYVGRHSAVWSDTDKLPVATVAPRAATAAPATAGMGAGLFRSSESNPPVNIVDPETRAPAPYLERSRAYLGLPEAVLLSKAYVSAAIANAVPMGRGVGPLNHLYRMNRQRRASATIAETEAAHSRN